MTLSLDRAFDHSNRHRRASGDVSSMAAYWHNRNGDERDHRNAGAGNIHTMNRRGRNWERFIASAGPFSLQDIINQPRRISKIGPKIADTRSHRFSDDKAIHPAGRPDHVLHQAFVEIPHDAIEWLNWVWDRRGKHDGLRCGSVGRNGRCLLSFT